MYSLVTEANLQDVDTMDRAELMGRLRQFKDCVRTGFSKQWMDRQSTQQLQILLLAAQLYRVVARQAGRADAKGRVLRRRRCLPQGVD
jgi:hypothetical protein